MTPDEINKAIAIECGWTGVECGRYEKDSNGKEFRISQILWEKKGDPLSSTLTPPDYYRDLNACADMEATLSEADTGAYSVRLQDCVRRDCTTPYGYIRNPFVNSWYWHASAPQRCEAFLRIKGKWKE